MSTEDKTVLINYKGMDVMIRYYRKKYQVGICGNSGVDMWIDSGTYDNLQLARTSGKEYACILIDRLLVSRKKKNEHN